MNHKQTVGKYGEDLAVSYLISKQYRIIARNLQTSYKEIDIVSVFGGLTVFIEVKTRASLIFGPANEALTRKKLDNFKRAVAHYCRKKGLSLDGIRLDLIAIDIDRARKVANIQHYLEIA